VLKTTLVDRIPASGGLSTTVVPNATLGGATAIRATPQWRS
jgi:hypothetical protein